MPDTFDPYHKWLGIPPKDQPPNHYRLLGIEAFESDADVVESAADQRMTHVRTYQAGQHSALSQRILNELSAAKLCLLDLEKKAAYDRQLRESLEPARLSPAPSAPATAPPSPRALPQARPLVAEPAPLIVPDTGASSSPVRRRRPKTPFWLQPGVLGTAGAALILALVGYFVIIVGQTSSTPQAPKNSPARDGKTSPVHRARGDSVARSVSPEKADEASSDRAEETSHNVLPDAKPALSLVADTNAPEAPGVIADHVVLWNQYNGNARDRGTRQCSLSLWREGRQIWTKQEIEVPWTPDSDQNVSVELPSMRFDRLRVDVTKWQQSGGGLAEIEVVRGDRNLALGRPARALASFDSRFLAPNLTDGVHTSTRGAFWLLPSGMPGWAEVDLAFAEPQPSPGVSADKLVIWNTHNAHHNDRGALVCNVHLFFENEEVWRQDDVAVSWQANFDGRVELALPDRRFDRVRIEIPRWHGLGAGLSEVEVKRGAVNLARACPVITSATFEYPYIPAALVDGITASVSDGIGYWLAPDNSPAWAEIDLTWNSPEIGSSSRALGQYRVLIEKDWPRGLPWLARSDDIELRAVAETDCRLDALPSIDGHHAPQVAMVGDRWWEIAQVSSEPAKQELLLRALYRYAAASSFLPENERPRLEGRISQCLPLPAGTWLYLLKESDVNRIWRHNTFRRCAVVEGTLRPWALWMIPDAKESASATFSLGGEYRRLSGSAALDDSSQGLAASPMTFRIVADDRELWASSPLQGKKAPEPFDIDVSGVDRLRLVVECPGSHDWCHTVWVDPILDAPSPSRERAISPPSSGTGR
jgi:hypothetical protein